MAATLTRRFETILPAYRKGDKQMHNLTPLGISMHFKELDRQAAKELRALPDEVGSSFLPTAGVWAILARLPRLVRANFLGRSLRHG